MTDKIAGLILVAALIAAGAFGALAVKFMEKEENDEGSD